ncbi:MAG: amino acid adenylation domain-containing protein [Verrucomicrobiota bacterium]
MTSAPGETSTEGHGQQAVSMNGMAVPTTWNDTAVPYPGELGLHGLFRQQAERVPSAVAVRYEGREISYGELDAASNSLAIRLRALGVQTNDPVGLYLDRGLSLAVGILGILKAGGAYLPLDSAHPSARLADMLCDAGVKVVVTQSSDLPPLPETGAVRVMLDSWGAMEGDVPVDGVVPCPAVGPRECAYIIYTSGSTGRPKGVPVRQHSAVSLICAYRRRIPMSPGERLVSITSPGFDISVLDYFLPLSQGAVLELVPREVARDAGRMVQRLREVSPQVFQATPSLWNALLESGWPGDPKLVAISGGETLVGPLRRRLAASCGVLWDSYGPTETTIYSTALRIPGGMVSDESSCIGQPLDNNRVYVLDERRQPVPVGEVGELYIGGGSLSEGYLNRPELTAERFLPDPFSADAGARMYRSGDQGRWRADGTLEFLGRLDHQIKLRGFRIELGEIEAALRDIPDVVEAAVLKREDRPGDPRLVAYVVARSGTRLEAEALRDALARSLPEYMVPSFFVALSAMPWTVSGKLDRAALPAPDAERPDLESAPVQASSPLEAELAAIMGGVLGIHRVGIHDHFFRLGGSSLTALKVLSRINRRFDAGLRLTDFLKGPTVAELSAILERRREQEKVIPLRRVTRPGAGRVPATGEQTNLWFVDQLALEGSTYHVPVAVRLQGPIRPDRLERALRILSERQDILATQFRLDDAGLRQEVVPLDGPLLGFEDLASLPEATRDEAATERLKALVREPFDLATAPLWRALLLRLGPEDHVLSFDFHHLLVDEWSLHLIFSELELAYRELGGEVVTWPELPVRFADFAVWESERRAEADLVVQEAYWKGILGGAAGAASLPADLPMPERRSGVGGRMSQTVDAAVRSTVETLAREESTSGFVVALAGWQAWMAVRSGAREILTGSPVAQREQPEVEGLAGLLLRTLPIRTTVDPGQDFRTYIRQVRARVADAFAHSAVSLARILGSIPRDPRSLSPFPTTFALVDREDALPSLPGLSATRIPVHTFTSKFDLFVHISSQGADQWKVELEYAADRFSSGRAREIFDGFIEFLGMAAGNPDAPAFGRPVTGVESRPRLPDLLASGNIMNLVEGIPGALPGETAIRGAFGTMSREELRRGYDRIAAAVLARGVRPGDAVALCAGRSPQQVAALLGVIKAGAAGMPVDPSYPAERRKWMLEDARPRLVIADRAHAGLFEGTDIPVLVLEDLDPSSNSPPVPACPAGPEDPVYLLFTSGSSGRPKGVAMPHRALVNLVQWQCRTSVLKPGDATLQFAPVSFDVSFQELFTTLAQRGVLVLVREEERLDPGLLLQRVREEWVRRLLLPFVALQAIAESAESAGLVPDSLGEVFTSGEALRITPAILWMFSRLPGCRFCNQYGPTETHVVTEHELSGAPSDWPALPPIGRPIDGARYRMVGEGGHLVPPGTEGELQVGGVCVALGYWNRPDLTAERFLEDPSRPGEPWYRTGDCVVERPDGALEFRGRLDDQVKVNGYRVELSEVEAALERHPAVRQAAASVRPGPSEIPRLVAWYVPRDTVDSPTLVAHLQLLLPGYMIPSALVAVDQLPRTPSGKLNRAALPEPAQDPAPSRGVSVEPSNPTESALVAIWRETLGVPDIGVHDNLFALGGNSLDAMRIVSRIRTRLSSDLSVKTLMKNPTIASLALQVHESGPGMTAIRRTTKPGDPGIPATEEQVNLWLAHQSSSNPSAYNVVICSRILGPLDRTQLERAWRMVLERQDILLTRVRQEGGGLVQEITGVPEPILEFVDLAGMLPELQEGLLLKRVAAATQACLDPSGDLPPWRFHVFRASPTENVLLFLVHHLLVGESSLRTIARELSLAYQAAGGESVVFPELPIRFADYAVWRHQQSSSPDLGVHEAYWRDQLRVLAGPIPLPVDRSPGRSRTGLGGVEEIPIPRELWERVEALARGTHATPYLVLLSVWQAWLAARTQSRDVVVASPVDQQELAEVESLVGLFLTTLPLRATVDSGTTLRALVDRVRLAMTDALAHAAVPMSRISALLRTSAQREALHQCAFALVDQPAASFTFEGTRTEPFPRQRGGAKFMLTLLIGPGPDGTRRGLLEYSGDWFTADRARSLADEFEAFLRQGVGAPDHPMPGLPPRAELGGDRQRTVPFRFAQQVARDPGAEALRAGSRHWSYAELDAASDALRGTLESAGVVPGARVGLHLSRCAEWVVAALAVLKAGAVYVPLLPGWPDARLAELANAADVSVVVGMTAVRPAWLPPEVPCLSARTSSASSGSRPLPLPSELNSESPAYILFTSGSTGIPKGVLVPHRAVHRLVVGQDFLPFGPALRFLYLSSPAFDASTLDVWAPLLNGGTCVVLEADHVDAGVIGAEIAAHRVNSLFLTTGLFNFLVDNQPESLAGVTHLVTGGEAMSEAHARRALERLPGICLVNGYGPTETTTFAVTGKVPPLSEWEHGVPTAIGRELRGTHCEILDSKGSPVPDGEPGELWIGGDGIALGYVNDPDLTAERFRPDPADPGGRAHRYRTGDLVRRLPDGRLEFVGRLDAQLKIRGHRIEPGEIEAILEEHPAVRTAVVVGRPVEGGVLDLVACLRAAPGSPVPVAELRERLAARLPEYMIPSRFEELDTIPLTSTGKVDRAALAGSILTAPSDPQASEGPRTPLEETLCREWEAVLNRSPVGIHDNFFDVGGQSLRALQLTGRLQKVLGRPVRVADLFHYPTIAEMAAILAPAEENARPVKGPFRGAATGVPWFHIPGVFGFEFLTPELAAVVGAHRPYFDGLQFPGLDGHTEPLRTVEAIAEAVETQLMRIYPQGPLWLSGYSFGGSVAYELARRLQSRGRPVDCVVLFDTCAPGALWRRPLPEFIRQVAAQGPVAAGRLVSRKLSEFTKAKVHRARRRWWTARERVEAASLEAHERFQPPRYDGRVVLLQGLDPVPEHTGYWVQDPKNGWGSFAGPRFEFIRMACNHHNVFLEPVSPVVLEAVRRLLSPG